MQRRWSVRGNIFNDQLKEVAAGGDQVDLGKCPVSFCRDGEFSGNMFGSSS